MLRIEPIADNILKVTPTGKLQTADFREAATQIDSWGNNHLKLLIDATGFEGWASGEAAKEHFTFVRQHQHRIDRIAVITGHVWQRWIAAMAGVFVHPEIKAFDAGQESQALTWLTSAG